MVPALIAATKAGEAILEVYHGEIDVSYKEDDSPLTLADKRAHSAIADHLSSDSTRSIPILSEEGKHTPYEERQGWEYYWLVDPLDGTKEFVKRSDEFTVNIALIKKNRPVLGVVFLPAIGSLYFAAEGLGSYKLEDVGAIGQLVAGAGEFFEEERPLKQLIEAAIRLPVQQSFNKSTDQLNLVGSRSHGTEALSEFVEKVKQQYRKVDFVPAGSALKLCLVAEGSADIYPRFGPTMEWDTAAGHCVVEQSGGKVVDMKKKAPLDYNKKDLHNPYFVCIAKHFREASLPL
ncbi:MAG: 3'(2'),5'-bisphosphate nucleotidase CysQ [Deltaproteobacteria bacterium]|jgi:3'(2'), 5'-bisphosphate nucleotidase|nr:3'(2'),5'-bisphosphate nucleotidase CysQ [Deltaproteobacteria bacterium]